jgi:cob(I)alamin adenosyltransferase
MKIYTGTGDRGKTSLFSGERVSKNSPRIAAYGDLDELNSLIGAIASAMEAEDRALTEEIHVIQALLLDVGAWLATTPGSASTRLLNAFTPEPDVKLKAAIDRMNESLVELQHFLLPGGHLSASLAHVARTVCRRTERRVIGLVENEGGPPDSDESMKNILAFLNRLSDYLFVVARYLNHLHGRQDTEWKG